MQECSIIIASVNNYACDYLNGGAGMKMYKMREAAAIFGIKVRTLRQWVRDGKVKAERDGNDWYWLISESEIKRRLSEINADKD